MNEKYGFWFWFLYEKYQDMWEATVEIRVTIFRILVNFLANFRYSSEQLSSILRAQSGQA